MMHCHQGSQSPSPVDHPNQNNAIIITLDINNNGLDKMIHHSPDKGQGKRHKFRVYLDSNENGRFDKNDH